MHVTEFLAVQRRTHARAQQLQTHLETLADAVESVDPLRAARLRMIGARVWMVVPRYLRARMLEAN